MSNNGDLHVLPCNTCKHVLPAKETLDKSYSVEHTVNHENFADNETNTSKFA